MLSLLTAGDKHFFKYVEQVKKQTSVSLNIWGINPLEVTHFKAGFLDIPPIFEEEKYTVVVFGTNIDIKEIDLSNIYAIPVILIVQYMIQLVVNIGEVYIRKKITFIFLTIILGTKMKLTLFLKNIIGKKQSILLLPGELEMVQQHFIIMCIIQLLDLRNMIHLEAIK